MVTCRAHPRAGRRLKAAARGPFDAIPDLITAVPIDVCREYFGVDIAQGRAADIRLRDDRVERSPVRFSADRAYGRGRTEDDAGAYVRAIVDRSIEREHRGRRAAATPCSRGSWRCSGTAPTPCQARNPRGADRHDHRVRADQHDGGRPHSRNAAAQARNDEARAAGGGSGRRRSPDALPVRGAALHADQSGTASASARATIASPPTRGTRRTIRKDTKVLAMTSSAMFDSRQVMHPFGFDPGRPASNYMHFGFGMHWCVGRDDRARPDHADVQGAARAKRGRARARPPGQARALGTVSRSSVTSSSTKTDAMAHAFITIVIPFAAARGSTTSTRCSQSLDPDDKATGRSACDRARRWTTSRSFTT